MYYFDPWSLTLEKNVKEIIIEDDLAVGTFITGREK
jgi:hypothetical protein